MKGNSNPGRTAGTIKELKVSEGDFVNEGDVLAVIE